MTTLVIGVAFLLGANQQGTKFNQDPEPNPCNNSLISLPDISLSATFAFDIRAFAAPMVIDQYAVLSMIGDFSSSLSILHPDIIIMLQDD